MLMESLPQKKPKRMHEIDRISQLPDEILHDILKFVDIVDVVRFSVLSRRWKSLWTTMPYLDFDIQRFGSHNLRLVSFQDLMNWVLMSQGANRITRFRLKCGNECDAEHIRRSLYVAARRNVQELELGVESWKKNGVSIKTREFRMPHGLITCESLRTLKLKLAFSVLLLPSYLKFDKLTCLHLEQVELTNKDEAKRLVSACGFLQELSLNQCVLRDKTKILDISSASLRCLTIHHYYEDYKLMHDSDGVYHVGEIRISCPNLLSLSYRGALVKNFCLDSLSSLETMCIHMVVRNSRLPKEFGHMACRIFKEIENIQVLELRGGFTWLLSCIIGDPQCFSMTFHRLKSINIWIRIAGNILLGSDGFYSKVFLLLKHCPNLDSLTLICAEESQQRTEQREFDELRFANFVSKNGLILKKFIIRLSKGIKEPLVTVQKLLWLLQGIVPE